ncbi:MAG TPA: CsgG/HfaB family protein [Spirochaetota bacterium]|nr:CsgG/HfaB family protein [Spirochaetota bacterium]HRX48241.1 CsgG/HfaB family protein [Spirochaetota bacterium]
MKKATILLTLFLLVLSCGTTQPEYSGKPQTIAVSTIINGTDQKISASILNVMTDHLITDLTKTNRFIVVERKRLDKIIKEHELGMTGLLKQNDAIRIGNMLQAEYIVLVSITQLSHDIKKYDLDLAKYSKISISLMLNARVISVDKGTAVAAASITHSATNNSVNLTLDSEMQYAFGSDANKLDPQIQEELFEAVEKLASAVYSKNF